MAIHSIFGTAPPSSVATNNGDSSALNLATAFYVTGGVTDWAVTGARVWIPSDSNTVTTGHKAYLWSGSSMVSATQLATVDFGTITKGAWNEVSFDSALAIDADTRYWISVYFPNGCYASKGNVFDSAVTSGTTAVLLGAAYSTVTPGNGAYAYGVAGIPTDGGSGNHSWYGIDVLVSDSGGGGRAVVDTVGVTDSVSAVRSGLPASVTFTGSATDTLGGTTSTPSTVSVAAGTSSHVVKHTFYDNSSVYGSALDLGQYRGPILVSGAAAEIGITFTLDWACRITGVKMKETRKAP